MSTPMLRSSLGKCFTLKGAPPKACPRPGQAFPGESVGNRVQAPQRLPHGIPRRSCRAATSSSPSESPESHAATPTSASKCPFAAPSSVSFRRSGVDAGVRSPVTEEALPGGVPESKGRTFLDHKTSNIFDGADPMIPLRVVLPTEVVLGAGVLLSAALSLVAAPLVLFSLAALMILPSLILTALRANKVLPDPEAQGVLMGPWADAMEGEFCVFILGTRCNSAWKGGMDFALVGRAFNAMMKELERMPESAGYVGGEMMYSGNLLRGSHVTAITYWRSYEHMVQYAHDATHEHTAAWRQLSSRLPSLHHIGLWHETYIVKPGQHESVYVNCPPLGLGAAAGLVSADGALRTSRGRVKASGKDGSKTKEPEKNVAVPA